MIPFFFGTSRAKFGFFSNFIIFVKKSAIKSTKNHYLRLRRRFLPLELLFLEVFLAAEPLFFLGVVACLGFSGVVGLATGAGGWGLGAAAGTVICAPGRIAFLNVMIPAASPFTSSAR